MKKLLIQKNLFSILFCSCIFVCAGCGRKAETLDIQFLYNRDYWTVYDMTETAFPTQESYEREVSRRVLEIEETLNIHEWWKETNDQAESLLLNTKFVAYNPCNNGLAMGGKKSVCDTIGLNETMLLELNLDACLTHELTHLVCNRWFSISLNDGLCEYVETLLADEHSLSSIMYEDGVHTNMYIWVDLMLQEQMATEEEIYGVLEAVGKAGVSYDEYKPTSKLFSFWMNCSYSFVDYLIQTYGIDAVVELIYRGNGEEDYQKLHKEGLEQLKEDWLVFVKNQNAEMSSEELVLAPIVEYMESLK